MSGIFTSVATAFLLRSGDLVGVGRRFDDFAAIGSDCPGAAFSGSMPYLAMASATTGASPCPRPQGFERRHRDPAPVDLEEVAQALAIVGAAEPIRAEHAVAARHERPIWSANRRM